MENKIQFFLLSKPPYSDAFIPFPTVFCGTLFLVFYSNLNFDNHIILVWSKFWFPTETRLTCITGKPCKIPYLTFLIIIVGTVYLLKQHQYESNLICMQNQNISYRQFTVANPCKRTNDANLSQIDISLGNEQTQRITRHFNFRNAFNL